MKQLRFHSATQLLVCSALLFLFVGAGCTDPAVTQPLALADTAGLAPGECGFVPNESELIARVVELVNEERAKVGLAAVILDVTLSSVADDYACRMITDGFFAHRDPDGDGPGERAINGGYVFLRLGENLAAGQTTPEQVMAEWMSSTEGHRENILSPEWTELGVGVRLGGEHGVYWVQEFGLPPGQFATLPTFRTAPTGTTS